MNRLIMYRRRLAKPARRSRTGADDFGDIAAAHRLFEREGEKRWVLEAMIVAGTNCHMIAEKLGLDSATIDVFEAAFFDVRWMAAYPLLVTLKLIDPISSGQIPTHPRFLLKTLALHSPDLLFRFLDPASEFTPEDWALLSRLRDKQILMNGLQASFITPGPESAIDAIRTYVRFAKRSAVGRNDVSAQMVAGFSAAANQILADFERARPELERLLGPLDFGPCAHPLTS